ncbi:MAG TPA: threonine/serine dehydratase [Candidatus Xenobia bacterium]|nr:threonine/serine dehydratase [Candidatus Xenobia bacterium]
MFSLKDFEETRAALRGRIRMTPLLYSDALSLLTGNQVYLKAESFQVTHSFKIRAAYGGLLPRLEEARKRGVVTGSSGNFAQAIAYAGHELSVPVTVVMLQRSARYKVEAARQWGAEIVFSGNEFSERNAVVEKIRKEQGKLLVHSFDDEGTIRGNGTLGLELLEQLPELDVVLVPTSGGGLLGGVAAVIKQQRPEALIYGVQPENMPAMKVSLQKGKPTYTQTSPSVADGLVAAQPGALTFKLAQQYVEDVLLVSEDEIRGAVAHLLDKEKLVIEPSGAVSVAALLRHLKGKLYGRNIVAVLTGGNVELGRLLEMARSSG